MTATKTGSAAGLGEARMLHTMLRVFDLKKSLDFYTRLLGMKLLRQRELPDGHYTLAFVGYGDEADHTVVELTHNWDQKEPYALGTAFGHLAVGGRRTSMPPARRSPRKASRSRARRDR